MSQITPPSTTTSSPSLRSDRAAKDPKRVDAQQRSVAPPIKPRALRNSAQIDPPPEADGRVSPYQTAEAEVHPVKHNVSATREQSKTPSPSPYQGIDIASLSEGEKSPSSRASCNLGSITDLPIRTWYKQSQSVREELDKAQRYTGQDFDHESAEWALAKLQEKVHEWDTERNKYIDLIDDLTAQLMGLDDVFDEPTLNIIHHLAVSNPQGLSKGDFKSKKPQPDHSN